MKDTTTKAPTGMPINQSLPEQHSTIEISSLSYRYPKAKIDALRIPAWHVARGERVFLHGASGSGKSTLLQLLCGLRSGNGELKVAGTTMANLSQAKRDRFRAHHIGMVFQQFNLIPYLSMIDNLVLAANLAGRGKNAKARARLLLGQVNLAQNLWAQPAEKLSIGQQQRVAIARALINAPKMLLFDEPTSALDDTNQSVFMRALEEHLHNQPETTVVFVSHDLRLASYFQRTVALSDIASAESSQEHSSSQQRAQPQGNANAR